MQDTESTVSSSPEEPVTTKERDKRKIITMLFEKQEHATETH